jgi:hypothetical protein
MYRPRNGDFDRNGTVDILWYAPGSAPDSLWLAQTDRTFRSTPKTINGSYDDIFWAEADNDAINDLIFWRKNAFVHPAWHARGDGTFESGFITSIYGTIPVVGDFDGDGRTDILWYGPGGTRDGIAYAAQGVNDIMPLTVSGDYDPIAADFDGDSRSLDDIYWWNISGPIDPFWTSTGSGGVGPPNAAFAKTVSENTHFDWTRYHAFVGHFDGDNTADILFYGPGSAPDAIFWGNAVTAPRQATASPNNSA